MRIYFLDQNSRKKRDLNPCIRHFIGIDDESSDKELIRCHRQARIHYLRK